MGVQYTLTHKYNLMWSKKQPGPVPTNAFIMVKYVTAHTTCFTRYIIYTLFVSHIYSFYYAKKF